MESKRGIVIGRPSLLALNKSSRPRTNALINRFSLCLRASVAKAFVTFVSLWLILHDLLGFASVLVFLMRLPWLALPLR